MTTTASLLSLPHILGQIDVPWLTEHAERLWKTELGATYRHYREAALYAESLLEESGLEQVERIGIPADGRTTYLDRTMPLAWEATSGRLTVKQSPVHFADPVVADYQRHPHHLAIGSVGTPPEGVTARLISERQLFAGQDARGTMVLLDPDTTPNAAILSPLLDLGAIGFVSSQLTGRFETSDGVRWLNAVTEGAHWYANATDRPFIGFSVSPRTGGQLVTAVHTGPVSVHVVSDARRCRGEFDVVTGVIPGEDERELWLTAHLYEPMADDNSTGVIGCIEIARLIRRLVERGEMPTPRFTLRLIFTMEMYGFAAYAARRGVPLRDRVLGAVNYDSIPINPSATLYLAPPAAPFFGDYLMEQLFEEHQTHPQPVSISLREHGWYSDECFLNDPSIGVPMVWLLGSFNLWHNSMQTMATINPRHYGWHTAFYGTWLARMLSLGPEDRNGALTNAVQLAVKHIHAEARTVLRRFARAGADEQREILTHSKTWMNWRLEREEQRLSDFRRLWPELSLEKSFALVRREHEAATSVLVDQLRALPQLSEGPAREEPIRTEWASSLIPGRDGRPQPHDQAQAPKEDRKDLPNRVIYGPLSTLLAHVDGRKSLRELIEYAEWTHGSRFSEGQVKQAIAAFDQLARHDYLTLTRTRMITRPEIAACLRRAGLGAGDLVLVHSSLSQFGYIEGGADAVVDAFLEVLGPRGTLLMPTFTNTPVFFDGDWVVNRAYRPFTMKPVGIWTGTVPTRFCSRPGVKRSIHPTHSVAGCGPLAEECLRDHRETDPPTCRRSPFGKLVDLKGKMVWFGAGLASTTFFHLLEDELNLPYLRGALCPIEREGGRVESVWVPKHLPGHRDFYHNPGEETKMYRRLIADGLVIQKSKLGLGWIKTIAAVQMYELGMNAVREDPSILLCDSAECLFCGRHRRKS